MELDSIITTIAKYVTALGVVGATSYPLFKYLGAKWLDNHVAQKLAALRAEQERSLAELKSEQDRSLRYVQSYIDREIHRARKLYDREFEVLSEAWRLLTRSFNAGICMSIESAPPKNVRNPHENWRCGVNADGQNSRNQMQWSLISGSPGGQAMATDDFFRARLDGMVDPRHRAGGGGPAHAVFVD